MRCTAKLLDVFWPIQCKSNVISSFFERLLTSCIQLLQHRKHESETRSFSSHWPQNVTFSNFDKIEGSTSTQVTPLDSDRPVVPSTVRTRMMQRPPVPLFAPLGTTWRRLWTPRGRATATAVVQDHPPALEGYAPHYG